MAHVVAMLPVHLVKRLLLSTLFSMGVFTVTLPHLTFKPYTNTLQMAATIVNSYFSIHSRHSAIWVRWYVREPSAAMLTATLPLLWPLGQMVCKLCGIYSFTSFEPPEFPDYPTQKELGRDRPKKQQKKESRWDRFVAGNRAPIGDMIIAKPNPTMAAWGDVGFMPDRSPESNKDPWKDLV